MNPIKTRKTVCGSFFAYSDGLPKMAGCTGLSFWAIGEESRTARSKFGKRVGNNLFVVPQNFISVRPYGYTFPFVLPWIGANKNGLCLNTNRFLMDFNRFSNSKKYYEKYCLYSGSDSISFNKSCSLEKMDEPKAFWKGSHIAGIVFVFEETYFHSSSSNW